MGWIRRLYEGAMKMGRAGKIAMPDFDEFWKKGYVMFDVADKDRNYVAFEAFRKDPKANALSTESGLIQLYSPKIASYGYDDCKGHPCFFEPTEGVSRATKDAPLALMACKSRYRMHSQLDGTVSHDFANIEDREPLWIHPDDAAARGIRNGDIVLVSNKRGAALAGRLCDGAHPQGRRRPPPRRLVRSAGRQGPPHRRARQLQHAHDGRAHLEARLRQHRLDGQRRSVQVDGRAADVSVYREPRIVR